MTLIDLIRTLARLPVGDDGIVVVRCNGDITLHHTMFKMEPGGKVIIDVNEVFKS